MVPVGAGGIAGVRMMPVAYIGPLGNHGDRYRQPRGMVVLVPLADSFDQHCDKNHDKYQKEQKKHDLKQGKSPIESETEHGTHPLCTDDMHHISISFQENQLSIHQKHSHCPKKQALLLSPAVRPNLGVGKNFSDFVDSPLAFFHVPWYNVHSYRTRRI